MGHRYRGGQGQSAHQLRRVFLGVGIKVGPQLPAQNASLGRREGVALQRKWTTGSSSIPHTPVPLFSQAATP